MQATAPSLLALGLGTILVLIGWGAVSMTVPTLFADQIRRSIRAIMSAVARAATAIGIGILGGVSLADIDDPVEIAAVQTQATAAFTLMNLVMAFVFGVISGIAISARRFDDAILYPGGGFSIDTPLTWAYALDVQERSLPSKVWALLRASRAFRRGALAIPPADAARGSTESPAVHRRVPR